MPDFSTDEKTNVLFKNFIGVPNTNKDREWYQESYKAGVDGALSSGHALNYNNSVDLENVWAADISTNFSASNESVTLNMYVPGTYTVVGNVSRDELGSVLKVEKLKLQRVESGNHQSWYCLGDNSVNVLKNIIPFNYKESGSSRPYAYILYNGSINEMPYGQNGGNWMIDHKSGVVYIPDDISGGIHVDGLYLTFYKYIGEPLSNVIITDDNNVKIGVLKNKYEIFKNEKRMIPGPDTTITSKFGNNIKVHGNYVIVKNSSTSNTSGFGLYNVHSGEEIRYYDVYNRDFAINDKYIAYSDWAAAYKVVVISLDTGEEVRTITDGNNYIGTALGMTNDYLLVANDIYDKMDIYDLNNSFNLISTKEGKDIGKYTDAPTIVMDGDYIASVTNIDTTINDGSGGVYVHSFSGGKDPVTTLVPNIPNAGSIYFGYDGIAIGGGYIAVGATRYNSPSLNTAGAVFIYKINGDKWNSLSGSFTPPDTVIEGDVNYLYFGRSVAISDGYLMVGSYKANKGVKIYNLETLELVQEVKNNVEMDFYGHSISAHNGVLVISDLQADIDGSDVGAVYAYTSTTKSNVQLLTNQLPRLHVGLGGNVGIGTTEPSYKLDVNGDARIRGNILGNTTFQGGNVGIGTTSPGEKLEILDGNIKILQDGSEYGIRGILIRNDLNPRTFYMGANTYGPGLTDRNLYIGYTNEPTISNTSYTNGSILTVRGDGSVGIGTTSPDAKLHIQGGSLHIYSNPPDKDYITAGDSNIYLDCNNGSGREKNGIIWKTKHISDTLTYTKNSAGIYFQPEGNFFRGGLGFYTNNIGDESTDATERMRITAEGNVGIGTNDPDSYKLEVNGNIYTTSGTITGSDDRLKHNEKSITNALDIIDKLEPKQYIKTTEMYDASHDFELDASGNPLDASGNALEKGKDYRIENGFIAQDLLKIPELSFVVSGGDEEVEVPIYEKDASGIVLDESGNIAINKSTFTLTSNGEIAIYTEIYEEDPSGNRVYKDSVYKRDASGNYELDASGEKIVDLVNEAGYKLDKEGNVMDETGRKIMDASGNVLDGSGNKKQVDVRKEIKSQPYGVDYMSICVLQMRAIQELQARLRVLEGSN